MLTATDGTTEIFTTEKSEEGDARLGFKVWMVFVMFFGTHRFSRSADGRSGDDAVRDVDPLHGFQWRRRVPSRERRFHQIVFGLAGESGWRKGRASEGRKKKRKKGGC